MSASFGDQLWDQARAGDVEALRRAADVLLAGGVEYAGHRARAFALALDGDPAAGVGELERGWTDEWPFPADFAVDVARVRFLAGEYREALVALQLAVRGRQRVDDGASELAGECVRRAPRTWWRALWMATAGGTTPQRARAAAAILRARFAR